MEERTVIYMERGNFDQKAAAWKAFFKEMVDNYDHKLQQAQNGQKENLLLTKESLQMEVDLFPGRT